MSQTAPDFTTAIVTILFLLILGIVALIIKKKKWSFKKKSLKMKMILKS